MIRHFALEYSAIRVLAVAAALLAGGCHDDTPPPDTPAVTPLIAVLAPPIPTKLAAPAPSPVKKVKAVSRPAPAAALAPTDAAGIVILNAHLPHPLKISSRKLVPTKVGAKKAMLKPYL